MAKKADEMTDEEKETRRRMRQHFYEKRLMCPFPWLQLDTDWYDDEGLQELRDRYGKGAALDFMLLIGHLANRRNHSYDTTNTGGWKRLTRDLELDTEEECRERIKQFAELGLITPAFYEYGIIQNARVMKSAEEYADSAAQGDYMAWCRSRNHR